MQEEDVVALVVGIAAFVVLLISLAVGAASAHPRHREAPTVIPPSFTPRPVPTVGPFDGYLGFPQFFKTSNVLQLGTSQDSILGGTWLEERGTGVIFAGQSSLLTLHSVFTQRDSVTIAVQGHTQLNNAYQAPYAVMSRYANVDLMAAVRGEDGHSSLMVSTFYRNVDNLYTFGETIELAVGSSTEAIAELASPNGVPNLLVAAESTNASPYIYGYRLSNTAEVKGEYKLSYGNPGTLYHVYGLDGNEHVCAVAFQDVTSASDGHYQVHVWSEDGNGEFAGTPLTLFSQLEGAPFDPAERTVSNCVGVGDGVIAVVTATHLEVFTADTQGHYSPDRRQQINLSVWDIQGVNNVQVEGQLIVLHDQAKVVLLMPFENPTGPSNVYSTSKAQVLALPDGDYGRLPVSYSRGRGVGELLLPNQETGVWTKYAWVLGSNA